MTWFTRSLLPNSTDSRQSATLLLLLALSCAVLVPGLILSGADRKISSALITWMNERPALAAYVDNFSSLHEVKGVVAALVVWWLWFPRKSDDAFGQRLEATALLGVVIIAIIIGRMTANMLPYRPRPFVDPMIVGNMVQENAFLQDWSSFPSDHAMIFGAFAVAMIRIAPRVGWWLLGLHVFLIVCLPRVLIGKHYVSDILAGLAVGVVIGWMLFPLLVRWIAAAWARVPKEWARADLGYPLLFLVTYEIATNFDGARRILRGIVGVLT